MLAITANIQGTSLDTKYQELGHESLSDKSCYKGLAYFCKGINNLSSTYLTVCVSNHSAPSLYNIRMLYENKLSTISCGTKSFKSPFERRCISESDKLDPIKNKLGS